MELPGYNLVRADHPTISEREGVCIDYHNLLPLKVTDMQILNECINFEIRISGKLRSSFVYIDHLVKLKISLQDLLS